MHLNPGTGKNLEPGFSQLNPAGNRILQPPFKTVMQTRLRDHRQKKTQQCQTGQDQAR
jgi:hypothetical protein